ncbi:hypothetical protein [Nocardiopsis ganjiahuensis]|uniref:hypothetical protein n=1 Tax=Nocardiopsis ganjiahuensis TaxID=239984 RepID=UPI0003471015|nr:hypothetical protein [Nocardiopsis ganjiahuensis]
MRRTLMCAALPLFLALTACGGDGGETAESPVEESVEEVAAGAGEDAAAVAAQAVAEGFVASLAAGDGEAGCAFTDEGAQAAIVAQSEAEDCAEAFPDYAAGLPDIEGIEIGEVTVSTDLDGETLIANVELVHPDEDLGALEVREGTDGEWRATRLPGTTLGGA